ncbi:MAG: oligosaccharide flippase family protein [Rhodospirillales bacterium]|jgi:O-antigen/teichoic acid export membrane protein|nr:oligosaccharide flippase family protein [Rhodospirillales bacterium]
MTVIDYKKLKVGGTFLIFGQVFQALLAFAVNLVLVRYIFPDEFGRFALALAGASIVYSVISPRINVLIIRRPEAANDDKAKDLLFSAMTLETLAATLIIFLWLAFSGNAGPWEILLVGAVGLRHWTDLNKAFFERTMPYRQLAILETGASTGGHLLALAMAFTGFGWVVLVVREAMVSLVNLWGLRQVGGLTIRRLKWLGVAQWQELFKEARGVWLDGVLEGNFQRLTILLAGLLGGEATAGLFFQAQRLAGVPHQVLSPIAYRILANWFGRTEDAKARRKGRDKFLLFLAPPLILAGVLTVPFADPVVPWLFGETWLGVADILAAMFGMVSFWSLFEVLKAYCLSTRQSVKLFGGRIVQYVGLLAPTAAGFAGWISADIALGIGLSSAYFFAFLFILVLLHLEEKKES